MGGVPQQAQQQIFVSMFIWAEHNHKPTRILSLLCLGLEVKSPMAVAHFLAQHTTQTKNQLVYNNNITHVSFTWFPTHTTQAYNLPLTLYLATLRQPKEPSNPWLTSLHTKNSLTTRSYAS